MASNGQHPTVHVVADSRLAPKESPVYNTIATTRSAYIANVLMSAPGKVRVSAVDSSKIQAVTIGFGLATGQFAGVGGTFRM